MENKVTQLGGLTTAPGSFKKVLKCAEESLEHGLIIGWDNDGELYFAGSFSETADILLLLERAKQRLLEL